MKKITFFIIIIFLSIHADLFADNHLPVKAVNRSQYGFPAFKNGKNIYKINLPGQNKSNLRLSGSMVNLLDSVYQWPWDTSSWSTTPDNKNIDYSYDVNNNLLSFITQAWNDSVFVNSTKNIYTWNADNNPTTDLYQDWNDSIFANNYKDTLIYNSNNKLINDLGSSWNDSAFVYFSLDTYTYDTLNNLVSDLYQQWDSSFFVNVQRIIYTYDTLNNVTNDLIQQWSDSEWMNYSRDTLIYNINDDLVTDIGVSWNDSVYVNATKDTFTYDVNKNQLSDLYQMWNDSSYVNFYKISNTYNVNNTLASNVFVFFDSTGTAVANGDSSYNYYYAPSGIKEMSAVNGNMTVYPNPARDKLTISNPASGTSFTSSNNITNDIEIYNVLGEKVYMSAVNSRQNLIDINVETLPAGVYFVQVLNNNGRWVSRFVKE